jgi:demethylmenaquinone methyltransferase/2-methoxy-6-polyprenyl-1,4-benzoquinol methylase
MPFIGGLLTGNFAAYRYLPETSQAFPSGKAFGEILNTANFKVVMITPLFGGIAYRYIADKPISRHS